MGRITVDGNTACARIAYQVSEIATIYPITPSSPMAETIDEMATKGVKNIFGQTVKVVEMQSEGGASGAMHGALAGGSLATTFTASQGLLLMIPNMYKSAGELLPSVMHVSARALSTHALSIFGDHSDVMAVRQTGYAMLASNSVQECMDMAMIASMATYQAKVPFVHFFDGFRTSHEINTIEEVTVEQVKQLAPIKEMMAFKSQGLNSSHPHQQGTAQNPDIYFQNRERSNTYYLKTPSIVQQCMDSFAKVCGRQYHIMEYYGAKNAKYVIVSMCSSCETIKNVVEYLNKEKAEYGMVSIHLYRPFDTQYLHQILPKTVQKIAVLDRTKESGSAGEPLYLDVVASMQEHHRNVTIVGGRYGLGGKELTPSMIHSVYENLKEKTPKNHFTLGIIDDITHTNLVEKNVLTLQDTHTTSCKFYGYGGDGTVSANKSTIKIIGETTPLYTQAFFEYDSKKTGNSTISHLRFGQNPITKPYLITDVDFVSVHKDGYLTKYNILKGLKNDGILLINTSYTDTEINELLPKDKKDYIISHNIHVYIIDAFSLAQKIGLGTKINLIMQTCFFYLKNIIPFDLAKKKMKEYAEKSYGKKGKEVLEKNIQAIEQSIPYLKQIHITPSTNLCIHDCTQCGKCPSYYTNFIDPIQKLEGNSLPTSAFSPNGFVPVGTSQYEKRGTAEQIPVWIPQNCIQCNMCAFACPHGAIRPYLMKEEDVVELPNDMVTIKAMLEQGYRYCLQVSPMDCTGCGVCANVCSANKKALQMTDFLSVKDQENKKYQALQKIKHYVSQKFPKTGVKGSQFYPPYFEYSGACAGCGETPYLKVLSQLFGDHMIIANATGCSSIYGGSAPTCPYTKDENGNGIAWASSLFEDNAEFGLGIKLATQQKQVTLHSLLQECVTTCRDEHIKQTIEEYLTCQTVPEQRKYKKEILDHLDYVTSNPTIKQRIQALADSFVTQSVWIIGGDGWAYDIGFGGLDHILASGENVNILVLDTEVYSNTGGQSSKSTPSGAVAKFASSGKKTNKKDLGEIAMTYKNVYVAKVSMGANNTQLLTALMEAEQYQGVSLVIAYAPCINHGIDMSKTQLEMKRAVQSGYWNLYRYNPDRIAIGENPLILDSDEPELDYFEFLNGENRYRSLSQISNSLTHDLQEKNFEYAMHKYHELKTKAEKDQ